MPYYYLSQYAGDGVTPGQEFRPAGVLPAGWTSIDLRPDPTSAAGWCLLTLPERADSSERHYLGESADVVPSVPGLSGLEQRLGITLTPGRILRDTIAEILLNGTEDGTRWRSLRPGRDRRLVIHLGGEELWSQPVVAGGATYTEDFNTSDGVGLGPDLTWSLGGATWEIATNRARHDTLGVAAYARADHDAASSNVFAQATLATLTNVVSGTQCGVCCRFSATETTNYLWMRTYTGTVHTATLRKTVAGTRTDIASAVTVAFSAGEILRLEADGSSISGFLDGFTISDATDTSIASGTRGGLYGYVNQSGDVIEFDDYSHGDLTTPYSSDNLLNPAQDFSNAGNWTTHTGATSNLWTAIDENTADDADFVQSPAGPSNAAYEVALESIADPNSSSGHIVRYRYQKSVAADTIDLNVVLAEGTSSPPSVSQTSSGTTQNIGETSASQEVAQSFAWPGGRVSSVAVALSKVGSPSDSFTVETCPDSSGAPGLPAWSSSTAPSVILQTTETLHTVTYVQPFYLPAGTQWLVVRRTGAIDASNYYRIHFNSTNPYTSGGLATKGSGGWGAASGTNDARFTITGTSTVATWAHSGIGTTWTSQAITLTAAQADLLLDYTSLRLRFTANTTANTTTPTKVADRATLNSNTAGTTFDHVLSGLTVGDWLIIRTAADNSGGGGAARTIAVTNQSGTAIDTASVLSYQQNNDPGAASAGTTANVILAKITSASGTVRLTYSGNVVQASVAEEWSGLATTSPVVGTPVGANGVASTNMASLTDSGVTAGNLVYAVEAVEGPSTDVYSQDADTTGGSWSDLTRVGTTIVTADSNQTTYGGYKVATAGGSQTYNPTIAVTARDTAGLILELAQGPATARAQVSWAQLEVPVAVGRTFVRQRRYFGALLTR